MTRVVGDPVTVRRTWRTTLLGTGVGGSAVFVVATPDPNDPEEFLYWNGSDTGDAGTDLSATETTFPLTQKAGGDWRGGYTFPAVLAGREVHEVGRHSVYGELTKVYRGAVLDVADAFNRPSGKHDP